jgi:hypothetical protein
MIILEGPDGTGKSTFANFLQRELGWNLSHVGPPPQASYAEPPGAFTQYVGLIKTVRQERLAGLNRGVIFDRFIYGERVYGPLVRNDTRFTDVHIRLLERALQTEQPVVLMASSDDPRAKQAWTDRVKRNQELVVDERVYDNICAAYRVVYQTIQLPKVQANLFSGSHEEIMAQLLQTRKNYWGRPRDRIILVGDFDSPYYDEFNRVNQWPAIDTHGPGYRFTADLAMWGIPESRLMWVDTTIKEGLNHGRMRAGDVFTVGQLRSHIIAFGEVGADWAAQYAPKDCKWHFVPSLQWCEKYPFHRHPAIEILTKLTQG